MAEPGLVDRFGRPLSSMAKGSGGLPHGAIDRLVSMGVKVGADGAMTFDASAVRKMRSERIRRHTVSTVPSTPRHVVRDGGGVGVRKGFGRFETLTLESLRVIRESSPILMPIHSARHHQVRAMGRKWSGKRGDIGWRVVHRDHHAYNAEVPDYIDPYIKRFERTLECPSPQYCATLGDLLVGLEEDYLTINRPVLELLRSAWDDKRIIGGRPVDGALIWPTFAWLEKWLAENPTWNVGNEGGLTDDDALNLISNIVGFDIGGAHYCLVREGVLEAVYTRDDLVVAPQQNRTDIRHAGYPPSHVEQAIELVLGFMNAYEFNSIFFTRGMVADKILGISGDVHDDDVDAFVDMLREATQGTKRAHSLPVMPLPVDGTLQVIDLKAQSRETAWEGWMSILTALCTAVYRMDPSEINAKPWSGGSSPGLSEANRSAELQYAKAEGLQGDLQHLAENVLTPWARTCHPDLSVVFEYGGFDPQKEAQTYEVSSRVYRTRNEIRLEAGDAPVKPWWPLKELDDLSDEDREKYDANPWNWPTDPGFAQAMQMQAMGGEEEQPEGGEFPPGEGSEQPPDDGYGEPANGAEDGYGGAPPDYPYGEPPEQEGGPSAPAQMQKGGRLTIYVEEWPRPLKL